MSFRPLMRRRAIAPTAAALAATGTILFPRTTLHAETTEEPPSKKPIYDDDEVSLVTTTTTNAAPTPVSSQVDLPVVPRTSSPTPTDRLASEIRKTRLFLYNYVAGAENRVNSLMDQVLHLENSFTSTIVSLAPPKESGEKLMPGSLYVLVAAMTGSILTRNRNILLRATVPLAVGIGAGWVVIPVTMRNISNLVWKYEERFPAVAETHIRTRDSFQRAWDMTKIHTEAAVRIVDEKVTEGREAVEGWVRKGR